MKPLVSILMPVYNCAEYIEAAIQSCLSQTYENFEIIIIDDGSTDETSSIIHSFSGHDNFMALRQTNAGRGAACNKGIKTAKGSLISFCDADDLLHDKKLELQANVMIKYPEIGLLHTARTAINNAGEVIGHPHARDNRIEIYKATQKLFHRNYICGPSVMIRNECFDEAGYFDESLEQNEDHDLYLRISLAYKFGYLNQEIYKYRKHDGQITQKRQQRESYKELVLKRFVKKHPNAVTKNDMNIAFANIHKSRGHELLKNDKNPVAARREFLKSLQYRPISASVWFRLIKSFFVS
jgi:glycosyltransferase involved in cell wall biosynthesis